MISRGRSSAWALSPAASRLHYPAARHVHVLATDIALLLADATVDTVDTVDIATAHSAHAAPVRECVVAGKPVLCESALVPNFDTAREIVAQARDGNVLLMEAFWTCFVPVCSHVGNWLGAGAIGRVRAIQSSFCGPVA